MDFLGTQNIKDQYADGKAANIYQRFIGDNKSRTENYKNFLVGLLRQKGCKRILDVACGTGIDSIMLLEEGFEVVSVDGSDKMLKYALKTRWQRRKEAAFDNWEIEEANWLSLYNVIEDLVGNGFDAVICFGNSFSHLLDSYGDQREQKQALRNFEKCVKPGGLLLIDHRNYDIVIETGSTSTNCVYYNSKYIKDITTTVIYTNGKPALVNRRYIVDTAADNDKEIDNIDQSEDSISEFRLSFYPHRLKDFKQLLRQAFGENSKYNTYGDFKPLDEIDVPDYYIHVVEKSSTVF